MVSSSFRLFRSLWLMVDAAAIILAYIAADILRCRLWAATAWPEPIPGRDDTVPIHFWMLAVLPVLWPAILLWHDWYDARWRSGGWLVRRAFSAAVLLALVTAALALVFQRDLYPRAQLGFLAMLAPATALLSRSISGLAAQWWGRRQPRHVLIVGTNRDAVRLRRLLRSAAFGRPVVVGHLRLPTSGGVHEPDETGAIIGDVSRLGEILRQRVVDEVLFAVGLDELPRVMPHIAACEEVGVTAAVMSRSNVCHSAPRAVDFHGVPLLTFSGPRHAPELLLVKRGLDVLVAAAVLALVWPVMLICAVLIKLLSPGPVLYRQMRSGLNGRPFEMLKFRTMAVDADERRAEVAHLNVADGPVFKAERDPRITPIGAWLRRYSLDELPQLLNVLRGDMAIVGPRPPLPEEVAQYDPWQRRRLSMRPGLTCLWQIKGRHRVGFEEWMQLDLFYIDHWSLKLDLLILGKTVVAVLSGSGA